MAATKLTDLATVSSVGTSDLTYTSVSAVSKGITWGNIATSISTLLGLGSIATQAANNVSITGGSVTGITDLAVADGGTGSSTAPNARTALGLIIGTDVEAHDATLTALAGVTTSADKYIYATASDTFTTGTITTYGRSLVDDADAATARTTLNVVGHAKRLSAVPDGSGQVYPFVVVGASNSRRIEGLGCTDGTTLTANRTWFLVFEPPNPLPAGTSKLNIWSRSLGTGNVIVNPTWASVANAENPDTITVTAEGSTTIALSATAWTKTQITLDADTIVAGEIIVINLVFEDTNNTSTAASTHLVSVIWE